MGWAQGARVRPNRSNGGAAGVLLAGGPIGLEGVDVPRVSALDVLFHEVPQKTLLYVSIHPFLCIMKALS
jgi:hypothetical protein